MSKHRLMLCERCKNHVAAPPDMLEMAVPDWTVTQYAHVLEHLREIREACGLTQTELAADVHAHQSHVVKWERWGTQPEIPNMRRIAAVLHRAGYAPPPDPGGWTFEQVLEVVHTRDDPKMFRALKVADQTVRDWRRRGSVPRLDVLVRVEAYCKGLDKENRP